MFQSPHILPKYLRYYNPTSIHTRIPIPCFLFDDSYTFKEHETALSYSISTHKLSDHWTQHAALNPDPGWVSAEVSVPRAFVKPVVSECASPFTVEWRYLGSWGWWMFGGRIGIQNPEFHGSRTTGFSQLPWIKLFPSLSSKPFPIK